MENVRDWCISRQLWWGHRIPAWYNEDGDFVVAKTEAEAEENFKDQSLKFKNLKQDEDVLDTWFSSWLWPISVFDPQFIKTGKPNKELEYYYPTKDLVTAPEIMFFWVARMIIAGYEYKDDKPFDNVYYTGIVRDKKGRKMSKSLGNSPDPLELINKYGADGIRMGMLFATPAGNDLPFEEKLCEQGRNFSNKIWNAFRFLTMNMEEGVDYKPTSEINKDDLSDRWMAARIQQTIAGVNEDFDKYKLNDALKKVYSLIWDDFCDWYIELAKPEEYGQNIPKEKLNTALGFFEQLMKLLHPFMPFISEEIWQHIRERSAEEALLISEWPKVDDSKLNEEDIKLFGTLQEMVSSLRNIRSEVNVSPKEELEVLINTKEQPVAEKILANRMVLEKLESIKSLSVGTGIEKPKVYSSSMVDGNEIYVPLEGLVDFEKERERIQKEIDRLEGFLKGIKGKLSNDGFVNNAPANVVDLEKKKKADTEESLAKLREQLKDFE
jgi:valyl-tRNA synthetase